MCFVVLWDAAVDESLCSIFQYLNRIVRIHKLELKGLGLTVALFQVLPWSLPVLLILGLISSCLYIS